ncbi:MAG: tripartite tricarboxylate transporter substrate binding protein, partial [Betaproteobacteria bacterium]|nr:tripartite tricarboxylate transporter substrate binding protein [Betaproteobacteria bacterium]
MMICSVIAKLANGGRHQRGWFRSVAVLLGMAGLAAAGTISAQSYPDRIVTIISPFAVGSSTDIMARLLAKGLNERLRTSNFIVDNKPGANGAIGTDFVAKARPNGYTLVVGGGTTHSQNPWLVKNLNYDPVADFEPIAGVGGVPLAILVSPELPVKTMDEFSKLVSSNPGKYAYGTAFGMGTVCGENINQNFKLDLTQVPYKS